jgi:hypothetical protein
VEAVPAGFKVVRTAYGETFFVRLATAQRSPTTQVRFTRGAGKGLLSRRPLSFPSRWRVRRDLHAHCHPGARRSGSWRDRGHCHVGRGRAGLAPMATTGKLGPPQLAASSISGHACDVAHWHEA